MTASKTFRTIVLATGLLGGSVWSMREAASGMAPKPYITRTTSGRSSTAGRPGSGGSRRT